MASRAKASLFERRILSASKVISSMSKHLRKSCTSAKSACRLVDVVVGGFWGRELYKGLLQAFGLGAAGGAEGADLAGAEGAALLGAESTDFESAEGAVLAGAEGAGFAGAEGASFRGA